MLRPPLQCLQNQQIQRPLQKFNPVLVPLSLFSHRLRPQLCPSVKIMSLNCFCQVAFSFLLFAIDDRTPLFVPFGESTFYPLAVDTLHPPLVHLLCRSQSARSPRPPPATARFRHSPSQFRTLGSAFAIHEAFSNCGIMELQEHSQVLF